MIYLSLFTGIGGFEVALNNIIPRWPTIIECVGYSEIDKYAILLTHDSPETLHYVDPPYVHSTRQSKHEYKFEMSDQDHKDLAGVLKSLKGKVVISGYPSPLYNKLYKGWRVVKKKAMTDAARKTMEVLWLNF